MKPIGVIGGIGPESTIDCYRAMIAAHRELRPDGSYPAIVISSIDANAFIGPLMASQLDVVDAAILGGPELPLILRDPTASEIPLLDTTVIHARAIVARAML